MKRALLLVSYTSFFVKTGRMYI